MTAPTLLIGLLLALSACANAIVVEEEGDGGLVSSGRGGRRAVFQGGGIRLGETWSSGNVMVCRTEPAERATLVSVEAVKVIGEVRLDRIAVRTVVRPRARDDDDPDRFGVGTMHGVPRGLTDPGGYVVPTDCSGGPGSKVAEIVLVLTKVGHDGGAIEGLRITYAWNDGMRQFITPVTFGLCGRRTGEWCG